MTGSGALIEGCSDDLPAEEEQRLAELGRLLGSLPDRQREVIVLRVLEGMSTRETAEVMRCREGTVKTHLHRGTAALRQRLKSDSK